MYVNRQHGFSLLELAVGLLAASLVLAGLSGVSRLLLQTDHKVRQAANMARIDRALQTYLLANVYLPCPDIDGDGKEDRKVLSGVSVCASREGGLPFNDLGVEGKDVWGQDYYYRVHQRAENNAYINDACEPASVLGMSGPGSRENLWLCPDTNVFYCGDITASSSCNDACTSLCTNTVDPRPNVLSEAPPYFYLATPPVGTVKGNYNLIVLDEAGRQMEEGVVAAVVSWGADGDAFNRSVCPDFKEGQLHYNQRVENCDGDRVFVDTRSGLQRDFVIWMTVNQAKLAIIATGEFR